MFEQQQLNMNMFNTMDLARDQRKRALMAQILGPQMQAPQPAPQNTAQGVVQGLGSIADGFAQRYAAKGPFPDAPGGAKPSFLQGLSNVFGLNKVGLY